MRNNSTIYIDRPFDTHILYEPKKKKKFNRFKTRTVVPELIDDFSIAGNELGVTLTELAWINKHFGGLNSSVMPIFKFLQGYGGERCNIADIGCGSGDVLNRILQACKAAKQKVKLIGLDANIHALHYAIKNHFEKEDVALMYADVINESENIPMADVYMLNLFLHHLEFAEIQKLLEQLTERKPQMIVINDLERSRVAYGLFTIMSKLKQTSYLSLHDGQLSITKGFNRSEMEMIADMCNGYSATIDHRWAFRWQLVLRRYN